MTRIVEEFNNDFLVPFMEILDKEDKQKYLIGDFNVDLLKIDEDGKSSTFFDTVTSNLFIPHIHSFIHYCSLFTSPWPTKDTAVYVTLTLLI